MRLADYLDAHGITNADFARSVGLSRESIRRYRNGERMPRPDEMVQIKTATKGIVSADDFLPAPKSTVAA